MTSTITFSLIYDCTEKNNNAIDLYDAAQAMLGFQRSLALTAHLILHDEIITQATSLRDAKILTPAIDRGSWKVVAMVSVVSTGMYNLTTAPADTVLGHMMYSLYDYVVAQSLGFHVDLSTSLYKQYESLHPRRIDTAPTADQRFDSLIEKCDSAFKSMHRPVVLSKTAESARLEVGLAGKSFKLSSEFSADTYEHMITTRQSDSIEKFLGRISSYNINTFKGRIFLPKYGRPVPFELSELARQSKNIAKVAENLSLNARERNMSKLIEISGIKLESKVGTLKKILVVSVGELRDTIGEI